MLPPLPIAADDVRQRLDRGERVYFLDTRSPDDWDAAATQIQGALRFQPSEIENHLRYVPQGGAIVTYCDCSDGVSSTRAAGALVENGWHDVYPLRPGEWRQFPSEPRR